MNPDGSDQKIGTATYYDETQTTLAGAIANEAGPPVNAMATALNAMASIPFPITTLAVDALSGSDNSGPSEAVIPRLGTGEWGSNQRLNKMVEDAAKAAGLDKDQESQLHRILEEEQLLAETAHRFSFKGIRELAFEIARGVR